MSIASNFPAIKPTLLLDFANTEELDSRITFTRASTATYYGTQTAKAEENLLLQSQDLTLTAAWGNLNSTDAADVIAAPDGTLTADSITDNATNAAHFIAQNITFAVDTTYTYSCFLKAGTSNFAVLNVNEAVSGNRYFMAEFDLSTGAVNRTSAGSSGTLTTQSITPVGSGWYRCVITGQTSVAATRVVVGVSDGTSAINSYGQVSYVGTGSDIYAWGAQLEQRSAVTAYTPTTTQPITNYIPVLETAASGVARFDHNPTTFESLGLLIEESRTNLVVRSEEFDNSGWTKTNSTITANTIVSPDGTLDADKHVPNSGATIGVGASSTRIYQSPSVVSGTAYVLTLYAKAAEYDQLQLAVITTPTLSASFSLTAGTVVSGTGATITSVGNGWYRCSLPFTADVTGGQQIRLSAFSSTVSTGDGYSGIYIWGAQLEAGAFATSYIPTVASQVTRAADAASMTGTNFSSWYNQGAGTLYAESRCPNGIVGNLNRIASLNDGTSSNRTEIDTGSVTATVGRITTNGTSQGILSAGSYTDFQLRKSALAIQVDNFTLAANTATTSDTSVLVPVVDRLMIGQSPSANSNYLNGTIKKLAYYPLRATNAQLQGLTS